MSMLRYIKHRALVIIWHLRRPKSNWDFIARAIVSIAVRWKGETDPVITYLGMFDTLRRESFSGRLIEFGGGYSTILASTFLKISNNDITSVDFHTQKYHRILNSKNSSNQFLSSITCISRVTVSLEQVNSSLDEMLSELDKFDSALLSNTLNKFGYGKKFDKIKLVNDFKTHSSFLSEEKFYTKFNALSGGQYCSEIVASGQEFEAYFFDCGEISSIAEFWLLLPCFKEGDYVLLHDIRFPKSIKNFLTSTFLSLSEQWDILYIDLQTPQGGLVARRV